MGVGVEAQCTPHSLIKINGNQSSGREGGREKWTDMLTIIFTSHGEVTSPQHKVSVKKNTGTIMYHICGIILLGYSIERQHPPIFSTSRPYLCLVLFYAYIFCLKM